MIGVAGGGGGEVKILPPPFRPLRGPYRADRGRFAVGRPERQVRAVNPPRRPPEPPPEGGPPAGPPKVRSPASPGARGTWPSGELIPGGPPQAWPAAGQPPGSFTPLTWRSDRVAPPGESVPGGPPYQQGPRLAHPAHLALGARDPPG